jgi:hypothetical protein
MTRAAPKTAVILLALLPMLATTHPCVAKPVQGGKSLKRVILDNSLNNKVVMFGGKHGSYRTDEDFVAELLPQLRALGFKYLAIEFEKNPRRNSLHEIIRDYAYGKLARTEIDITWINRERKYCAGTFDLIATAKNSGMQLILYDADEGAYDAWNEREQISFSNLKELIFEKDPDAKVVILCGASHINEKPHVDMSADLRKGHQEMEYLACYIDKGCTRKNLTVSLLGRSVSRIIAPHCDMVVDLDEHTYYYTFEAK